MIENKKADARAVAVILAAGKGVRMHSERAKVLYPLAGRPILAHVLNMVNLCTVERIFVIVGHQADAVMAAFPNRQIEFILQKEQRGTGHALMQAEKYLKDYSGEMLALPGDAPLLRPETACNLLETHRKAGATVTLLTSHLEEPSGYGRIIRSQDGALEKIVEHKAASPQQISVDEINTGIYCFEPAFLFPALKEIRDDNPQHEFYLTDVVEIAVQRGVKIATLKAEPEEALGINTRVDLAHAGRFLREEINRKWMLRGVSIVDPASTYIDCDAQIGEETVIHPACHITGSTVIGKSCIIMPGAIVIDSRLGEGSLLGPYCIVERFCLPEGGKVAPFELKRGPLTLSEPSERSGEK